MKIEYLRYLLEIDKQHTISTAAKNLYMGQTTLSSIVKSVEDELGYAVFQRTPKGVVPTHNGEQLLEAARSIVKMYDKVLAIKDGNALPYEIAGQMSWKIRSKNWEEFPLEQKYFAVEEALAHLDYLEAHGFVRRQEQDGRKVYFVV